MTRSPADNGNVDTGNGEQNFSEKDSRMRCKGCRGETQLLYWCETCQRPVPEKRCPSCGLKSRKFANPSKSSAKTKTAP